MEVFPNAKINIGLNITEKRPDGYHTIETVFYPIGLSDVLIVEPSTTCSDYNFTSAGIEIGGDTDDNLIVKAYKLLKSKYEIPPIDITLVKQIPFGAGLGGGSADAAFMMKALNELFQLQIETEKLEELAVQIGADCPVFIQNKPVFATGIGNEFTDITLSLKDYFLVLVKPEIHVSTPDAYAQVVPAKPSFSLKQSVNLPVSEWKNCIKNDFEVSVFAKYPEIATIKSELYKSGALYAAMSGSGSSVFGIFESEPSDLPDFGMAFVTGGYLK